MRKSESEQMTPEELMLENVAEAKPSAYIDLQTAISIIMETVSTECPIEELMSVAADVAMKYHDGDSAFFFNYDRGMKTAQCTYETHRANFPPICGTEPLYLDEYPTLLKMMMDVITGIAARKEFVSFPDFSSFLPSKSREARRMEQVGLHSALGVSLNAGRDFIVVVNLRKNTDHGDVLRMLGYVLTTEIEKRGSSHSTGSISFGKGELAENEVYVGLLNGFELRTKYGSVTEKELTSGRGIILLTILLFEDDHMLSRDALLDKIWGSENNLSDSERTLNNIGYRTNNKLRKLFRSHDFLEKDRNCFFISNNYKITTELDAISYEIRDIEGVLDDEKRLERYIALLDRFSAVVLPRQKHQGIEQIVRLYDEKKVEVQNTVLELMYQLKKYEEMKKFIDSICSKRGWDAALAYWHMKSLIGMGKHGSAQALLQKYASLLSVNQKADIEGLLGANGL